MRGATLRPARGRGRAARDRRGAGPRPRLAAGPARPDPPGAQLPRATPTATRSSAGPTTWRGSTVDDLRAFYRPTTGPTAPCWSSSATSTRARARPGRGPLRRRSPRRGRRPAPTLGRAEPPDRPARLHAGRAGVGRARPARLAHRPAGPSRRPGARRPVGPADLRPALAALGRPGRARAAGHLGRGRRRSGRALGRAVPASRSRPAPASSRRGSSDAIADVDRPARRGRADRRGAGPLAAPARGRLAVGAGGPRRAWPRASAMSPSGTTGEPGRPSTARPWPSTADDIRRVASTYLVDVEPDGRLVAAARRARP